MSTLLLFLLQLLQGAGVPVELARDGTIVLAPRSDSHRPRSVQARVDDGAPDDEIEVGETSFTSCDISNGF